MLVLGSLGKLRYEGITIHILLSYGLWGYRIDECWYNIFIAKGVYIAVYCGHI